MDSGLTVWRLRAFKGQQMESGTLEGVTNVLVRESIVTEDSNPPPVSFNADKVDIKR